MLPSGSMITNSVTKTAPNSVGSKNSLIPSADSLLSDNESVS